MNFNCRKDGHTKKIDYCCIDINCKDYRLSCQQCRAANQHFNCQQWLKDYDELKKFSLSYNLSVKQDYQKIDLQFNILNQFFNLLRNQYRQIFYIELNEQDTEQFNNTLNLMLTLQNEQQILIQNITKELSQTQLKVEQYLKELEYIQLRASSEQSTKNKLKQLSIDYQSETQTNRTIYSRNLKTCTPQINYDLISNLTTKQQEWCLAIAFNSKLSIIASGCNSQIKLFEQNSNKFKQLQLLTHHTERVTCLSFLKETNRLVSGSIDYTIIIWMGNMKNKNYEFEHCLTGHENRVVNLITNKNEDLIVSCGMDYQIKFWNLNIGWINQQTIRNHTKRIYSLTLNDSQNLLISCGEDALILVMEKQSKNLRLWQVRQSIYLEYYGCRVCFINDNLFSFQPWEQNFLLIYQLNQQNKQFQIIKQLQVQGGQDIDLFPQQFIKPKSLLINKNSKFIQIIKVQENGEFKPEITIVFQDIYIYGAMSDDGNYLITWDWDSQEFQIRQFNLSNNI